jgi:hypothetical protein
VERKALKEDNWATYFAKIRGVCPWSYQAHMNNNIMFVDYSETSHNTWAMLFGSTKHEAFVYKCTGKTVDWLTSMCDELNEQYANSEWLWSHPEEGGDSTPIPVLIQQNKAQLEQLREKIGYEEE